MGFLHFLPRRCLQALVPIKKKKDRPKFCSVPTTWSTTSTLMAPPLSQNAATAASSPPQGWPQGDGRGMAFVQSRTARECIRLFSDCVALRQCSQKAPPALLFRLASNMPASASSSRPPPAVSRSRPLPRRGVRGPVSLSTRSAGG